MSNTVTLGYQDRLFAFDLDVDDASPGLSTHVVGPPGDDGRPMGADFASTLAVALDDRKKRRAIVEHVLNTDPRSDQVPPELRDGLRGVQSLARSLARGEVSVRLPDWSWTRSLARSLARGEVNIKLPDRQQRQALRQQWNRASETDELELSFMGDSLGLNRVRKIDTLQSKAEGGRLYTDIALLATVRLCVEKGHAQVAAFFSGKLHGNGSWQGAFGECAAPSCEALFVRSGKQTACCKACVARVYGVRKLGTSRPRPPKLKPTDSPFWIPD